MIEQIVAGVATGCVSAGAALIGGETAEMPGMYEQDEYDLAGFTVGIAEKSKLVTGEGIKAGDVVIGISSNGIHSNGYSLVRKVVESLDLEKTYGDMSRPLGEVLLEPTKIYVKQVASVLDKGYVKGIAHITGGGFYENFPRMLHEGLDIQLDQTTWTVPEIFTFLQEQGNIPLKVMYGVFNMGIGMAVAVAEKDVQDTLAILQDNGEKAAVIGQVTNGEGVQFV